MENLSVVVLGYIYPVGSIWRERERDGTLEEEDDDWHVRLEEAIVSNYQENSCKVLLTSTDRIVTHAEVDMERGHYKNWNAIFRATFDILLNLNDSIISSPLRITSDKIIFSPTQNDMMVSIVNKKKKVLHGMVKGFELPIHLFLSNHPFTDGLQTELIDVAVGNMLQDTNVSTINNARQNRCSTSIYPAINLPLHSKTVSFVPREKRHAKKLTSGHHLERCVEGC